MIDKSLLEDLVKATIETMEMTSIGVAAALIFGGILGVYLYLWKPGNLKENRPLYYFFNTVVNIVRSFPFVILLISLTPFTKVVVGSSIGPIAASVPLSVAAIAYFARIVELSLNDVSSGVIEAAQAVGASTKLIIFEVLISESKSSLILGVTSMIVSFTSYSAAAGIVGGGGLGDLAIRYGYYRFQTDVMVITVVILVVFIQTVQFLGGSIASRYNRK